MSQSLCTSYGLRYEQMNTTKPAPESKSAWSASAWFGFKNLPLHAIFRVSGLRMSGLAHAMARRKPSVFVSKGTTTSN